MSRNVDQSLSCIAVIAVLFVATGAWAAQPKPGEAAFFEKRVRPVLMKVCFECHGGEKVKSGLRVDSREALVKGGDGGAAIEPGKPERSRLIRAVSYEDDDLQMPPEHKLEARQIEALRAWVKAGAPWPEKAAPVGGEGAAYGEGGEGHWAFQPIAAPDAPEVSGSDWVRTPIDRFILSKLEAEKLEPMPRASKRKLIRRASFDLLGLPPTRRQVQRFLSDDEPGAFSRLVERLLASPEYGRRWGRHWLDVARYADTAGDTSDYPIPQAYRYRDYVIEAFNEDKPYDQFIKEQLAGDILAGQAEAPSQDEYAEKVTATGFLALSQQFGPGPRNEPHLIIEDTISTVSQGLLGMTVGCARCHDHKFDPISVEDYYGLYGYFQGTVYPHAGSEESPKPGGLYPLTTDAELRGEFFRYTERMVELGNNILQARRGRGYLEHSLEHYRKEMKELRANRPAVEEVAFAVRDASSDIEIWKGPVRRPKVVNQTGPAKIQKRGNPHKQGETVPRGFLDAIDERNPEIPEGSSGRLQLAEWIASEENPLTARVMVNRIWQWHFNRALVGSPNNFGTQGKRPTHPALLDWLARRFVDSGWSIKDMHRLIMNSAVYQLSARSSEANRAKDASNRWYWRFNRKRLDAESLRDAILAVSGTLDRSSGGAHPFPPAEKWGYTQHTPFHADYKADYESNRRSVYLMTQRLFDHPFLGLFDGPDRTDSVAKRRTTTVPLQALYMMNSGFMAEQAGAFAERVLGYAGDRGRRLAFAHELAWSRPLSEGERETAHQYLDRLEARFEGEGLKGDALERRVWTSYARVLLSSNEFVYVE